MVCAVQDIKGKLGRVVAKPKIRPTLVASFSNDNSCLCVVMFEYLMQDIDGKDVPLNKFKGKILLIVNVASRW